MASRADIDRIAQEAFKALQDKARAEHGGDTQPFLVVYAVESFLRRLSMSDYAQQMVLKGGMLMAASQVRRMTKDADLSTHGVADDEQSVRDIVAAICALEPDPHDGVVIDTATIRTETMREQDEYSGVRCKLVAALAQARIPFVLDFSFGDPDRSTEIELDSVIDRKPIRLAAYPLALNLAEKIVTAMQRRETSTRDRDFADLWVTSRRRRIEAIELRRHVLAVASHRGQPVISMTEALANMPDRQQPYEVMVKRMSYLSPPPKRWTDLIGGVIDFVDPLLSDEGERFSHWDPEQLGWRSWSWTVGRGKAAPILGDVADTRPPIPEPVKRVVRQRCGFGCVICGLPLYEYDHLVPWTEVREHNPENLVLLCDQHHREKTSGLLPVEAVREANATPYNRRTGVSRPYDLHYSGDSCEADIGSNRHVWPSLEDGAFTVPLIVDDTPIVLFRAEDGHLLLSVQLFDDRNELLVQIIDNQLVFSAAPWDVEFQGRRLTVRGGPGDIFVRMTFEPPARVVIDRAHIWRNGIELEISPEKLFLTQNRNTISGCTATNCILGIAVGDPPPLGGAIVIGSARAPFPAQPATEPAVRRLVKVGEQDNAPVSRP